jgi:hypothetical protein
MDKKEKLIFILRNYVKENEENDEKKKKCLTSAELYNELINILTNKPDVLFENRDYIILLLDTIYRNKILGEQFTKIIIKYSLNKNNQKEINQFIKAIKINKEENDNELDLLKMQLENNKNYVKSAKRAIRHIQLKTRIGISESTKYDVINVITILKYAKMSGKINSRDLVTLSDAIYNYNASITINKYPNNKGNEDLEFKLNKISNILNGGFEVYDKIDVLPDKEPNLLSISESMYTSLTASTNNFSFDDYEALNLPQNEYNFVLITTLNKLIDELFSYYKFLTDGELYFDKNAREEIIINYYKYLKDYLKIRKYYDELNSIKEDSYTEESSKEEENKTEEKNILIYSKTNFVPEKVKIISDLKEVPFEYYDTIINLLENFKSKKLGGTDSEKIIHTKKETYIELRDDQIRIIMQHVKENIYVVFGLFVKKANNDRKSYFTITNRIIPDISSPEKLNDEITFSKSFENKLKEQLSEKSRKRTR